MFTRKFSDHDIEQLICGLPTENRRLAELTPFIDLIRASGSHIPSETTAASVAVDAAKIARATHAEQVLAQSVGARRPVLSRLQPQIAVALVAVFVLAGMTGVALAADGAAPGDALYGVDRALERIGIGAGRNDERLAEASQLVANGQARSALELAAEALDQPEETGEDVTDIEAARTALEAAAAQLVAAEDDTENSTIVQENVATLLRFLSANVEKGVGLDGKEFGQGVAALARDISTSDEDATGEQTQGNSSNNDDAGGPPVSTPGNGNGNDPPDETGPPDDSPSETAPGRGNKP